MTAKMSKTNQEQNSEAVKPSLVLSADQSNTELLARLLAFDSGNGPQFDVVGVES